MELPACGSWVYLGARGHLLKIGTSINPRRRTGPRELNLDVLALMPGGRDLEKALHRRFRHLRLPGTEWFILDQELIAFVNELHRAELSVPMAA